MRAVKDQGRRNTQRVENILELYEDVRIKIRDLIRSEYTNDIVDSLFDKPIFRSSDIQKRTSIPKQTLMPILKKLIEGKIIVTIREAKGRRPAVLKFPKLLEITEN